VLLVSSSIERVSIADGAATIRGFGLVNGARGYRFTAIVVDGGPDMFGITIQRPDGRVVYQRQQSAQRGELHIVE
jgi:hypothetical protein